MAVELADPHPSEIGMIPGMTPKAKIAISIRQDLLDEIQASVERGVSASVSAYIEKAIESQLRYRAEFLQELDDLLEETGGPATEQETAWAERALGMRP
jgi:hypothetical protein